jgi:hypothetical protein
VGWLAEEYCVGRAPNIEEPAKSKDLQAAWGEDEEAGRYVEFHSRGGIMGYSVAAKCGKS